MKLLPVRDAFVTEGTPVQAEAVWTAEFCFGHELCGKVEDLPLGRLP
jgi:hypothetical protein